MKTMLHAFHARLAVLLPLVVALAACSIGPAPTPTQVPTPVPVVATQMPAPTSTPRPTATATATFLPPSPTPTPPAIADPLLAELEAQGYSRAACVSFDPSCPVTHSLYLSYQGQFGDFRTGCPEWEDPHPPESLTARAAGGTEYTYLEYCSEEANDCRLLFYATDGQGSQKRIADVAASGLSKRVGRISDPLDIAVPPSLAAYPFGWSDLNENGRPDIAVAVVWGNNYTGGEMHIFEVAEDGSVVCLTRDLPGPLSHWTFRLDLRLYIVIDDVWARHDCLFPKSPSSFWVYAWDPESGALAEVTAQSGDLLGTGYETYLERQLEPGGPFKAESQIGALVSLLLLYDGAGQREEGWSKFLALADEKNWPGTSEADLAWLRADVAHFRREYEDGAPFTPNNYGCQEKQ